MTNAADRPSSTTGPSWLTLLDVLDDAAIRYGDRPALSLRRDDGSSMRWSFRELDRRTRIVAWRLRALGLKPGNRLLTWSPSTPELPAVYFGAIRAGVVVVPLDLRMAPETIERIAARADASRLAIGTGRDSPDPRDARLENFATSTVDALAAEPNEGDSGVMFPADWETQVLAWPRPRPEDLFEVIFTSGTTGNPKGVMLTHRAIAETVGAIHHVIPPQEHRLVSLLPLSHLMEQVAALFYALTVGGDILYVRSRNPRVIFEAIRDHRVTTMLVVPQILDLFWGAVEREVEAQGQVANFNRLRAIARHLPYRARRLIFRRVHQRLGGGLNLLVCAAAFLPPQLQQAWEEMGVVVMQGYGATECGMASVTTRQDHGLGTVGRTIPPIEVRLAADGEIQVSGPTLFSGYWHDPATTAEAYTPDGWYRTGDIGRHDASGHLILMGRTKDIIVLPNGLNVYPEDIENALRIAGIRDSVVVETRPGRIEAIVLAPGSHALPQGGDNIVPDANGPLSDSIDPIALRIAIEATVKAANGTLAAHQRVAAWRLWPEADFPRTHTLKVKRDQVRAWAVVDEPLPVRQG
ncbi:MAG: AMP-binding protein [Candidatus Limnocylindrales bacterium]